MQVGRFDFLKVLELGDDADERAVRRAYAQRLKQIDQAADPQGFQALRGAYESAMRWLEWKSRENDELEGAVVVSVDDTAPRPAAMPRDEPDRSSVTDAPADDAGAPAEPSPQEFGEQVFASFLESAHAGAGFGDEAAARRALESALADDRLVNLEARTFFEWRIASLLMNGWRPGHEFLFGPACEVFQWEKDRRHLMLFGPLGSAIDSAINEKMIFFRQPPGAFEVQRRLIRRLRSAELPSAGALCEEMPLLQQLLQRYPHWLQMITSRENVGRWRQAYAAIPPEERESAAAAAAAASRTPVYQTSEGSGVSRWLIGLLIMVAISAMGRLCSNSSRPDPGYKPVLTAPATPPSRGQERWVEVDPLVTRQREVNEELRKALDDLRQAGPKMAGPKGQAPQAPTITSVIADEIAAPAGRSPGAMYELLRRPDGAASSPRLGS